MKLLTKTIQETHTADYVIIELTPEMADWFLKGRELLGAFGKDRPQNTARWLVCDDPTVVFLQTKACAYSDLDQYAEKIKNEFFVQLPDFFEYPETVSVPLAAQQQARDRGENDPPAPTHEDKPLKAKMERTYLTLDPNGVAWHGGADTYGRRAVSSPRMTYDLLMKLTGLTMPAGTPVTTEGTQNAGKDQQQGVEG
jgi:hypothetical protein